MAHTPPPWIVSDERDCERRHFASIIAMHPDFKGVEIARLDDCLWRTFKLQSAYREGEGLDNAHLIAAAPDFYEACQAVLCSVTNDPNSQSFLVYYDRLKSACAEIQKAIAKAEGRSL